jgi:phosphoglucosamine mutase
MAAPRLFGTDGVRGRAGRPPLDAPTIRRLGAAIVRVLPPGDAPLRVLIGRDTRESGPWIEAELAHGARGAGAIVTSTGVVPTPAVAYLTRAKGYDLGVVISASHNPFADNGIKVFSGRGEKFGESLERGVEEIMADARWTVPDGAAQPVSATDLSGDYLDRLRRVVDGVALGSMTLAIDCSNGAASTVGPAVLRQLGLDPLVTAAQPDGRNINLECGSTHPEGLARVVIAERCQLGVAFDGDADRAIFVDDLGRIVNGDAVLLMCARQLQREGRLPGNAIVATVMSNIGLELALRESNIGLVRCPVGDKYVMEEMLARKLALGGEQSGHIIFSDHLFTGDGLCTALNVMRTMALTGRALADLASDLVSYPQVLMNMRIRERFELAEVPSVAEALARVESRVAGQGRLLVRYSGTEPILRVMLEGRNEADLRAWGQEILDAVARHAG